jgi:hypothetical protein
MSRYACRIAHHHVGTFLSQPPPRSRAHAHQTPPNPPQTHPLTPALPQLPPAARSSRCSAPAHSVSSLFSLFLRPICLHLRPSSQPAPQSTPSLHQLLPVPGPDPSRAPLWCLGGVRARHTPQPPYPSRVGCGPDATQPRGGSWFDLASRPGRHGLDRAPRKRPRSSRRGPHRTRLSAASDPSKSHPDRVMAAGPPAGRLPQSPYTDTRAEASSTGRPRQRDTSPGRTRTASE